MYLPYKIIFVVILFGFFLSVLFPFLDYFPHVNNIVNKADFYFQFLGAFSLLASGVLIGRFLLKKKTEENMLRKKECAISSCINAIAFTDLNGVISYVNRSFIDLWGYESVDDILGRNISDFYPYEERKRAQEIMNILKKQKGWRGEIIGLRKDKNRFFSQISTNVVCDKKKRPICYMSSTVDITDKKNAEEKLVNLEKKLTDEKKKLEEVLGIYQKMSSILHLNQLVDFVVERSSEILEADKCSLMLFDDNSEELIIKGAKGLDNNVISKTRLKIGEPLSGLAALNSRPMLVKNICEEFPEHSNNRPNYKTNSFMTVPIIIHNKLIGVVNVADKLNVNDPVFNEIDLKILSAIVRQASLAIENAEYYKRLEYLSDADSTTGIYNHKFFIQNLDKEIERIIRYPKPLTLLMIDVDDFKSYNDKYGHVEGDFLLKDISSVIFDQLRSIDVFCRYSGDQFVAVLPETDINDAQTVAKKIFDAVDDMKTRSKISLSIGISRYVKGRDRRDLIMKADSALMEAKKSHGSKMAVSV